jgi:hypothetical protein
VRLAAGVADAGGQRPFRQTGKRADGAQAERPQAWSQSADAGQDDDVEGGQEGGRATGGTRAGASGVAT